MPSSAFAGRGPHWTRYAFASRWRLKGRSGRGPRLPEFVFAEYLAIADTLLTVTSGGAQHGQR